jgi:hypothetical protein
MQTREGERARGILSTGRLKKKSSSHDPYPYAKQSQAGADTPKPCDQRQPVFLLCVSGDQNPKPTPSSQARLVSSWRQGDEHTPQMGETASAPQGLEYRHSYCPNQAPIALTTSTTNSAIINRARRGAGSDSSCDTTCPARRPAILRCCSTFPSRRTGSSGCRRS